MPVQFSAEDVRAIVIGSERLNQQKREIGLICSMVRSLVDKEELKVKCNGQMICSVAILSEGACRVAELEALKVKGRIITIRVVHGNQPYDSLENDPSRLPARLVPLIHAALPDFLTELREHFPSLAPRLNWFIFAGKEPVVS